MPPSFLRSRRSHDPPSPAPSPPAAFSSNFASIPALPIRSHANSIALSDTSSTSLTPHSSPVISSPPAFPQTQGNSHIPSSSSLNTQQQNLHEHPSRSSSSSALKSGVTHYASTFSISTRGHHRSSSATSTSSLGSSPVFSSAQPPQRSVTLPPSHTGPVSSAPAPPPLPHSSSSPTSGFSAPPHLKSRSSSSYSSIIHSGEVIASSGILRGKKKDFVVLTNSDILRFKNRQKAADIFPSLATLQRHPSSASIASHISSSNHSGSYGSADPPTDSSICSLNRITAVFEVGPTLIEIAYVNEQNIPHSTILQLTSRSETELWTQKLHLSIPKTTPANGLSANIINGIQAYLRSRNDYYTPTFKAFRIVIQQSSSAKQSSHKSSSSSEDLAKLANASTHGILAVGHYAIYLFAIDSKSSSSVSSSSMMLGLPSYISPISSHGILALVHLAMSPRDATLYLSFRAPLSPIRSLELASYAARDIIQHVRSCIEHLRPCWVEYPLTMDVPEYVQDEPLITISPIAEQQEVDDPAYGFNGFNMTLAAYCVAFGVPNSRSICFETEWDEENGLIFRLLPRKKSSNSSEGVKSDDYTVIELLAVMRSLRWNEAFGGISFADVSLKKLVDVYDQYASIELDQTRTATGRRISKFMKNLPILKLEMQLIMLCSTALRMLDLQSSLPSSPAAKRFNNGVQYGNTDPNAESGCGVIDALMQVAKRATSNVDSFIFSNIHIDLFDFDYLVDVSSTRASHMRNLEIAHCGLYEREISLLLQALEVHENTLEGLDISDNPGRVSVYSLNESLFRFQCMRNLYMRKLLITSEDLPLLSIETLSNMRLKRLVLDGTRLRSISVEHLCQYLESSNMSSLVQLSVQSCQLNGSAVGGLLAAIGRCPVAPHPDFTLQIGDNPLGMKGFNEFLDALLRSGIKRLLMPRIEFQKERMLCDFFRILADDRCELIYLDVSLLLIPDSDASPATCDFLGEVFARNRKLRYINLAGETSKLQVARIGHGIGQALEKLSENTSLRELHIEGNELSVDGALLLSKALQTNRSIRKVYLDDNNINLQGFTAIVNSIVDYGNTSIRLVSLPFKDQERQLRGLRDRGRTLENEISFLRQQKRSSGNSETGNGRHNHHGSQSSSGSSGSFSSAFKSTTSGSSSLGNMGGSGGGDLAGKVEARQKVNETLGVLEAEWSKVYDKLDSWIMKNVIAASRSNIGRNSLTPSQTRNSTGLSTTTSSKTASPRSSRASSVVELGSEDESEESVSAKRAFQRLEGSRRQGRKISAGGRIVK
ncbi:uncharacterized protein V1516DRAFT_570816 [Lipomyces oligophaga]|uniref:uncharacterized protein n=1 Tax=Lipomyces oligophaga TaxID=45792 RepID=UPI0034CEC410